MAYTVTELITRAWYLSGIVSRNLEVPSGDQMNDGLKLLNALLSFKTSDAGLVPYYKELDITLNIGQELYFVPNLVLPQTFTFNIGPVRYPLVETGRDKYFATARVDNINSLPFMYRWEREVDGTNLYVYFLPNQVYPAKIWGKFALINVSFNDNLETNYDDFYIEYLRYALAEHMCSEYAIEFQPIQLNKLRSYEARLRAVSPPDLSLEKASTFAKDQYLNYGYINLSGGWTTP